MSANEKMNSMGQPVAELPVADVERAQRHYRDALGFEIGWLYPGNEIGAVSRDQAVIFFRKRKPPFEPAVHWVFAEDVEGWYRELKASGASIVDPLEKKPWGLRQFTVQDLDGNLFYFYRDEPDAGADELKQTAPGPVLNSVEAQLFVANIETSCEFYRDKLGFAVAFVYGDPPFYGQVFRDKARLNLRLVCEPVFAGDVRRREGLLSASINVATAREIEELFLSYQAAGVVFHQTLKTEPWGAKTFVVSDPDENLILFAGPEAD